MREFRSSPITLITDFGTVDGYAGAMKGVLTERAPDSPVIDITHDIPAGDIRAAAYAVSNAIDTFPAGTVHVVVVDPGVGSARAAVAVCDADRWLVGPDNGVFSLAASDAAEAFVLDRPEHFRGPKVSPTFAGRDVFAPVAAALATGRTGAQIGTPYSRPLVRLPELPLQRSKNWTEGCVAHVDRFGNLVTNLCVEDLPADSKRWIFRVGSAVVHGLSTTYSDVPEGEFLALIGSGGAIEISVRDGSAHARSGAGRDCAVRAERRADARAGGR